MLRIDRLRIASHRLTALIAAIPTARLVAELPDGLPIPGFLAAKLIDWLRATATDSLRRSLDRAAQSPDESDAVLQHAIAIVAWLDGQTDSLPPALESDPAITSRFSDEPRQERPH